MFEPNGMQIPIMIRQDHLMRRHRNQGCQSVSVIRSNSCGSTESAYDQMIR
jgi:hypothetical protein